MVVAFRHPYFREVTVRRSPIRMDGSILMLEPHEEADFRFTCRYHLLGEVVAYDFPLEHWTLEHITIAFWAIGNVCCVDPDYLRGNDFSTVRVLLLVDNLEEIPERLVLRNLGTGLAAVARLRVVDFWIHPEGASLPAAHVISSPGDDDTDDTEDTHSAPGSRWTASHSSGSHFHSGGSSAATRRLFSGSSIGGGRQHPSSCLGPLLYPSVPLWSVFAVALKGIACVPPVESPKTPPRSHP